MLFAVGQAERGTKVGVESVVVDAVVECALTGRTIDFLQMR